MSNLLKSEIINTNPPFFIFFHCSRHLLWPSDRLAPRKALWNTPALNERCAANSPGRALGSVEESGWSWWVRRGVVTNGRST